MTHTIVSDMETINKLYRPGKVQKDVILSMSPLTECGE